MGPAAAGTFLLLVWLASADAIAVPFTYSNQTAWATFENSSCDGTRQSPVDIPAEPQLRDGAEIGLRELAKSDGWNAATRGTWLNNGHTVQYTPDNAAAVTTETHLGEYRLVQLHFHWGPDDSAGSEHSVNGARYSGELHFVHQKASTPEDAGNTYTVVGVLLRADSSLELAGTVWDNLGESPAYETDTTVSGIVLWEMLPTDRSYYYYNGSLTTPLCNEVVQWVLLRTPVNVPAAFFERLRMTSTDSENSASLETNYREVQPLNDRQVYVLNVQPSQVSPSPTPDSAAAVTSTLALLLLVAMATLLLV